MAQVSIKDASSPVSLATSDPALVEEAILRSLTTIVGVTSEYTAVDIRLFGVIATLAAGNPERERRCRHGHCRRNSSPYFPARTPSRKSLRVASSRSSLRRRQVTRIAQSRAGDLQRAAAKLRRPPSLRPRSGCSPHPCCARYWLGSSPLLGRQRLRLLLAPEHLKFRIDLSTRPTALCATCLTTVRSSSITQSIV